MKYRVIVQPGAENELEEACRWIAEDSPDHAAAWFNGWVDALKTLAHSPRRCAKAPEDPFFEEEIRQLLYGKRRGVYRILFTIRKNEVHVLHVRHSARDALDP